EVVELLGTTDQGLQGVRWRNRRTGAEEQHAITHLFVFTGADPAAAWLNGSGIPIDEKGFIRAGADVRSTERSPLPLETGVEGVFAVGDVRGASGSRVGGRSGRGLRSSRSCTPSSPGVILRPPARRTPRHADPQPPSATRCMAAAPQASAAPPLQG